MNNQLIQLTRDEPKLKLLQAMGSKTKSTSHEAQELFAAFAGGIVQQVLDQAPTHKLIYGDTPLEYDPDLGVDPYIPLEYYHDIGEGLITIYSQATAGAAPTNEVVGPVDEFRLRTLQHSTAVSMKKCHARNSRLDVLEGMLHRVVQELLIKTEVQAWSPILQALANSRVGGSLQLIEGTKAGQLTIDDFNRLWTKVSRFRQSWAGGTPVGTPCRGLTDLFVSPELLEDLRSYAYEPSNTKGAPDSDESTALGLPESMRESIFRNSGIAEIFGVNIVSTLEFGVGQAWNELFDSFYNPSGGDPTFTKASQEIALGVDLSCRAFESCLGKNPCETSPYEFHVDDQFHSREDKIGYYVNVRGGYAVKDSKNITGIII